MFRSKNKTKQNKKIWQKEKRKRQDLFISTVSRMQN